MTSALCHAITSGMPAVGQHTNSQLDQLLAMTDAQIPVRMPLTLLPSRFHSEVARDSLFLELRRVTARNRLCLEQNLDRSNLKRMPAHTVIHSTTGTDWVPLSDVRFVGVTARESTDFCVLFVPESLR
jgi:hypothetical protein